MSMKIYKMSLGSHVYLFNFTHSRVKQKFFEIEIKPFELLILVQFKEYRFYREETFAKHTGPRINALLSEREVIYI